MPRPRKIDRPIKFHIAMPESIHGKMMRELYSEIEGRVPYGAVSMLLETLVSDWLQNRGVEV